MVNICHARSIWYAPHMGYLFSTVAMTATQWHWKWEVNGVCTQLCRRMADYQCQNWPRESSVWWQLRGFRYSTPAPILDVFSSGNQWMSAVVPPNCFKTYTRTYPFMCVLCMCVCTRTHTHAILWQKHKKEPATQWEVYNEILYNLV